MNKIEIEKKIEALASQNPVSRWKSKVEYRRKNKDWLQKSATIAVHIFERLKELGKTQKELAAEMSVSPQRVNKILKGAENLTIETISKIESILGIKLHEVLDRKAETGNNSTGFEYYTVINQAFFSTNFDKFVELKLARKTLLNYSFQESIDLNYLNSLSYSFPRFPETENSYQDVFDKSRVKEEEDYFFAA